MFARRNVLYANLQLQQQHTWEFWNFREISDSLSWAGARTFSWSAQLFFYLVIVFRRLQALAAPPRSSHSHPYADFHRITVRMLQQPLWHRGLKLRPVNGQGLRCNVSARIFTVRFGKLVEGGQHYCLKLINYQHGIWKEVFTCEILKKAVLLLSYSSICFIISLKNISKLNRHFKMTMQSCHFLWIVDDYQ